MPENLHERDAAILERAKSGQTFAEIGRSIGLSRERVRQIAVEGGLAGSPSKIEQTRLNHRIADFMYRHPDLRKVCSEFDLTPHRARAIAARHGIKLSSSQDPEMDAMIERVRNGEVMMSVAGGDRNLWSRLQRRCAKLGIKSRSKMRRGWDGVC